MKKIASISASFLGAGYSPFAPGTVGAIFGVAMIYALSLFVDNVFWIVPLFAILSFIIGIWSIANLPDHWTHDDSKIVIDEAHGLFITMAFVPISVESLLVGLCLFRFFDILKPLGIRRLDELNSNASIMLDDSLAGVYSNIVLQGLILWGIL